MLPVGASVAGACKRDRTKVTPCRPACRSASTAATMTRPRDLLERNMVEKAHHVTPSHTDLQYPARRFADPNRLAFEDIRAAGKDDVVAVVEIGKDHRRLGTTRDRTDRIAVPGISAEALLPHSWQGSRPPLAIR